MTNTTPMNSALNNTYDRERFAGLVSRLKGNRSIMEMSCDTGISVSFLSKALSQNLPTRPSKRIIRRLLDSDVRPQADVTYSEFLESCGYDAAEDTVGKKDLIPIIAGRADKRIPHISSLLDAISFYYDTLPITQAQCLLTNMLIAKGMGPKLDIRLRGGFFEIEDPAQGVCCVGISGFCQDKSGVEAVKMAIRTKIFDALCSDEGSVKTMDKSFYILVDDLELYNYCVEKLPPLHVRGMMVIYTDDYQMAKAEFEKVPISSRKMPEKAP